MIAAVINVLTVIFSGLGMAGLVALVFILGYIAFNGDNDV